MATKLQSKSYLPGYSLLRDLNEDPNNTWSRYYLDKKVNEYLYVNHMERPVNEYSVYDKEMLKRTMLEQEAMFQKQVYELHRLYRIYKDMMDECQMRRCHMPSVPAETSQSNSFSSQMRSENSHMIWQLSNPPIMKNCYDNVPFVGTHDMKASMSFLKEGSVHSGIVAVKNSSSLKENVSDDYKFESHSRKLLDLHLPAAAYIDLEVEDTSERKVEPKLSAYKSEIPHCTSNPENFSKLTLGNGEGDGSRQAECLFGLRTQKIISAENTGRLNKLTTNVCSAQPEASTSLELHEMRIPSEKYLEHHMTVRSHKNHKDKLINMQSSVDFGHLDVETSRQYPLFTNDESGISGKGMDLSSQSHRNGSFSMLYGPLQLNHVKIHESHHPDSNKLESCANGVETFSRGSNVKISNNSNSVFPSMPVPLSGPHNNVSSSSLVSSRLKALNSMRYLPTSTGELPCSSVLSNLMAKSVSIDRTRNAAVTSEICQNSGKLTSARGFTVDDPYYSIGSYPNFHLNLSYAQQPFLPNTLNHIDNASSSMNGNIGHQLATSAKDYKQQSLLALEEINLNQVPSCATDDLVDHNIEKKNKDLSGVPSWLKKEECSKQSIDLNSFAPDMEFISSDDHCQQPNTNFSSAKIETEENKAKCSAKDFPAVLNVKDDKVQVLPAIQQLEHSLSNNLKTKRKDELLLDDLNFDQEVFKSKKKANDEELNAESSVEKDSTNYRGLINLNVELPLCDEVLPNSELAVHMQSYSQTDDVKTTSKIELEMKMCHDEGSISSQHESIERDISGEKEGSFDTLAKLAAENIVAISMHPRSHQDEVTCHYVSSHDSLHWFADIALSTNTETKKLSRAESSCQSSDAKSLDLFEAMTLELEEVKVYHLCRNANEPAIKEDTEEEDVGVASRLFTRRRRGQTRRWRQRKDFQKDVLPGIASLTRHEVTEDLQLIGGLKKATGRSRQSSIVRKKSDRNGTNTRAKSQRKRKSHEATETEIQVSDHSQLPAESNNNEPSVVGSRIIGWGRTTRRCKRQKSLPSNLVSSLV